jgi:hypothetical protein
MSQLNTRISAFSQLGSFLSQFTTKGINKLDGIPHNDLFFDAFKMQVERAHQFNGWFTKENVLYACEGWYKALTEKKLKEFTCTLEHNKISAKKIAIVMAGNIPLVGFHDFLSVLISGHSALIKQSSNDKHLLPILAKYLQYLTNDFENKIIFCEEKLDGFDAVIATGSDNTARYFDHYFGKYPSIIRKSRNSVAILTGHETDEELAKLSDDIFTYFGLGCRSVSKIFVPVNYNFDPLFNAVFKHKDIINNAKYANNYDYNKAVYLMSLFDLLENGFLMLKEDPSYSSPISSLFYEKYEDLDKLKKQLTTDHDQIQCIVANGFIDNEVKFGETQKPKLTDYADGVNTLAFLSNL